MSPKATKDFAGFRQLIHLIILLLRRLPGLLHLGKSWQNIRANRGKSEATNPGNVRLSRKKFARLTGNYLYSGLSIAKLLDAYIGRRAATLLHANEHLMRGDSRAAVVVSISPLVVAAYSSDIDCVALLIFPDEFVQQYRLTVGSRLLTVNTYFREPPLAPDLAEGSLSSRTWKNFSPYIADFLSDETVKIETRKRQIDLSEWERASSLGFERLKACADHFRDGSPFKAMKPAV